MNHLRERVNMTHVLLSIPAIIIAAIFVGIPLNKFLGGTRSALQRIAIAVVSVPTTVILAVALFTFNALIARYLCSASTIRGLDLAGIAERAECLR